MQHLRAARPGVIEARTDELHPSSGPLFRFAIRMSQELNNEVRG